LQTFNITYIEINEYNSLLWSKYLLIVWLFYGTICILCLYLLLFSKINFILKIVWCYCFGFWLNFLLFIIFTASEVHSEAKKSYNIFNTFIITIMKARFNRSFRQKNNLVKTKLKVC